MTATRKTRTSCPKSNTLSLRSPGRVRRLSPHPVCLWPEHTILGCIPCHGCYTEATKCCQIVSSDPWGVMWRDVRKEGGHGDSGDEYEGGAVARGCSGEGGGDRALLREPDGGAGRDEDR